MKQEDDVNLWNLKPHTHVMCRYDGQSMLKKSGGVFSDLPIKLALKLRDDLNLFNSEKYGSVWVDCQSSFNVGSKKKC